MSPEKKKLAIQLALHTVLLVPVYFILSNLLFPYIQIGYLVLGGGLALGYVIYNKGFVYRNVTPDEIGGDMTLPEKQALLAVMKKRDAKSKWILTLIIPILLTLFFDCIILFFLPMLEGLFS